MRLHTGVYGHRKRVHRKLPLGENILPHRGTEPASAACRYDALPTELHPHPVSHFQFSFCLLHSNSKKKNYELLAHVVSLAVVSVSNDTMYLLLVSAQLHYVYI